MRIALSTSRASRFLGLWICLVGVASVSYSYFMLPLYAPLEGNNAITGWEWASSLIGNMLVQGVSPSFLFGIALAFMPLVAAALVGVLGIVRFVAVSPYLAVLYLTACTLGTITLALTLVFVIYGLRLGALGEVVGYALCFWADRLWRGKQSSRASIEDTPA